MALISALVDVQDSTGASLIPNNADNTRPIIKVKLGTGVAGSFAKDGETGIVTIAAVAGGAAADVNPTPNTLALRGPSGEVKATAIDAPSGDLTLQASGSVKLASGLNANNNPIDKATHLNFATLGGAPGTPASGTVSVYALTADGALYMKDNGGNVVSLSARPLVHRFIFAAGANYTSIAATLAGNAALAAQCTLVNMTGVSTGTTTYTPPAGALLTTAFQHQYVDFAGGGIGTVDWELTTTGATLFPGIADDIGGGAATGTFNITPSPDHSIAYNGAELNIGTGTVTVAVTTTPATNLTGGAAAVVLSMMVP